MSKKFSESLTTAVLTSEYIVKGNSPIVYVTHHEDGVWEFWGREQINESEIMVISLGQIIKVDPSILDIADLPIGFVAVRKEVGSVWNIIAKKLKLISILNTCFLVKFINKSKLYVRRRNQREAFFNKIV